MKRGNSWAKYIWLAVVFYMMYTVGRLAFTNYQFKEEERKLQEEVSVLENEVQDLRNKIVYYQSDSYKEKMLRAKLNMQKEGEKVVIVPPEPPVEKVVEEKVESLNKPQRWLKYFFGI